MENIVGIIVGFALTTVAGGWWATRLQDRSWVRQNDVRLRESENERAGVACQDLTVLLDRRLYRMQRLLWAADEGSDESGLERRRQEYLDVLFAWNDRLNTNLSLVGSYSATRQGRNSTDCTKTSSASGKASTVVRAAREARTRPRSPRMSRSSSRAAKSARSMTASMSSARCSWRNSVRGKSAGTRPTRPSQGHLVERTAFGHGTRPRPSALRHSQQSRTTRSSSHLKLCGRSVKHRRYVQGPGRAGGGRLGEAISPRERADRRDRVVTASRLPTRRGGA